MHSSLHKCVYIQTKGARKEHQYMNFSTSELTWSSEIKCKPSLHQNKCLCVHACKCARVFKQKVQRKEHQFMNFSTSELTWNSEIKCKPSLQYLCTKTNAYIHICRQVQASMCVETKGAKKEHQYIYLSTRKLTLSSEIKCKPSCALTLHRNKKKSRNGIACHMIKALSLDC